MIRQKLLYKPIGMVGGVAAGAVAAVVFKRVWRLIDDRDEAPRATDKDFGWPEILIAAALQGAIFGVVKAAIDRGGATAVQQVTGRWPD